MKNTLTLFLLVLTIPLFSQVRIESEAKGYAEQLYNRIIQGESMSVLAALYSEDPGSAKVGGQMEFEKGKYDHMKEFEKEISKLQPNELSKPFKTKFGYHIVQLIESTDKIFSVRQILISFK